MPLQSAPNPAAPGHTENRAKGKAEPAGQGENRAGHWRCFCFLHHPQADKEGNPETKVGYVQGHGDTGHCGAKCQGCTVYKAAQYLDHCGVEGGARTGWHLFWVVLFSFQVVLNTVLELF